MPLSKARMKARKRKDRLSNLVKPKVDALQSTTRPLKEESNGKLPSQFIVTPNENVEMARQMLPIQMKAYAIANKPEIDADGEPIPEIT